MSRLKMFCTREELTEWLKLVCAERGLGVLVFRWESGRTLGTCVRAPEELTLEGVNSNCYLFPLPGPREAPTFGDFRSLERSWTTLWPGGERQSEGGPVLEYAEFHAPREMEADLQWLKRRVKKALQAGVIGRNDRLGGEAAYRDFFHSGEARRLLQAGTQWRQFGQGLVSFEPLSNQ